MFITHEESFNSLATILIPNSWHIKIVTLSKIAYSQNMLIAPSLKKNSVELISMSSSANILQMYD